MSDVRNMSFGLEFDLNAAPLEEVIEAEQAIQDGAQEAADSIETIGARAEGIGAQAVGAFGAAADAEDEVGIGAQVVASEIEGIGAAADIAGAQGVEAGAQIVGAEQNMQQEAQAVALDISAIGVNLGALGKEASQAFHAVAGGAESMGASVRASMLASIKQGDSLAKTLKAGLGAAFQFVNTRAVGFGASIMSVAKNVTNALKNPVQAIKATLGGALMESTKNVRELGKTGMEAGIDLGGLSDNARSTGDEVNSLGQNANAAGNNLQRMGSSGSSAMGSLIGKIGGLVAAIGGMAIISSITSALKDFISKALEAASAAEETESRFNAVFKEDSDAASQWAENFGAAANRSKSEVQGFLTESQTMFTAIGVGRDEATDMSKVMTSLAYDVGSYLNIADADAFALLKDGLNGNAEALAAMGVSLDDAAIKQEMHNQGLHGSFDKLSEAEKMQVRFGIVLDQTTDAQQRATGASASYTDSVKNVNGVWSNFLDNAGAQFTPALKGLFDSIVDNWPTIEPMLNGLVEVLASGFEEAIPIITQLGMELLPVLVDSFSMAFNSVLPLIPVLGELAGVVFPILAQVIMVVVQVLAPLLPIIGQLAATLLPPLLEILGIVAATILPPLVQILGVVVNNILPVIVPVLSTIVSALLPPLASLLGLIVPLLEMLAPALDIVGGALSAVAGFLGGLIDGLISGVQAIGDFFSELIWGADEAAGAVEGAAEATAGMEIPAPTFEMPEYPEIDIPPVGNIEISGYDYPEVDLSGIGPVEIPSVDVSGIDTSGVVITPEVEIPDTSPLENMELPPPATTSYTAQINQTYDATKVGAVQSWSDVKTTTENSLNDISSANASTYGAMANDSQSAWNSMVDDATSAVTKITQQIDKIAEAARKVSPITIKGAINGSGSVPHNAKGDDDFEGGWTYKDEESGELAFLPSGTAIIPADRSKQLIDSSAKSGKSGNTYVFNVQLGGPATEEDRAAFEEYLRNLVKKIEDEKDKDDATDEQYAFA